MKVHHKEIFVKENLRFESGVDTPIDGLVVEVNEENGTDSAFFATLLINNCSFGDDGSYTVFFSIDLNGDPIQVVSYTGLTGQSIPINVHVPGTSIPAPGVFDVYVKVIGSSNVSLVANERSPVMCSLTVITD